MNGKYRDTNPTAVISDEFLFVAEIYDYPDWEEGDAVPVREVEMIDFLSGCIWYSGGFRSTNHRLVPKTSKVMVTNQRERQHKRHTIKRGINNANDDGQWCNYNQDSRY